MMYDQHSARLLRITDWKRHGALRNPPASVRQWGQPLSETELAALGRARLAASTQVHASDTFWQHHPADQRAYILCAARVSSAEPGWEILLLDDGQRPIWSLKGDRGAELHCACHCEWRPDCPGVVSVPAGSGPRPSPAAPAPAPAPVSGADGMRWQSPAVQNVAEPQQTASVPDGWRWPSSVPAADYVGEADRGELHAAHQYEQDHDHHPSPALPAPHPDREAVPLRRRGLFGTLFGRREETLPPVAVPAPMVWPAIEHHAAPVGEWSAPEPSAIGWEQSTGWALDPYALEALPASSAALTWDAPAASWEAALTPPDPLIALPAPDYSTPTEIDAFMEAVRDTAPPAIEVEPAAEVPALPPPDGEER